MGEKILVLDTDKGHHEVAKSLLGVAGYEAVAVEDEISLFQVLKEEEGFAAVLVREDTNGGINGLDVLQDIKTIFPEMPVVVSAASWTPRSLQCCTRVGAFFCLEKEAEGELLVKVINKAIEENKLSSKKESA